MRSFSSFKPVTDAPPREAKQHMFALWLRANAFNVKRPFDRATWRTARPWLTWNEVRKELKSFRDRSLGILQLGNIQLKNNDVETAVKYEAFATRKIFQKDIKEMIFHFYDYSTNGRIPRRDVLDRINEEFVHLNRGAVSERDLNWKKAIKDFDYKKKLRLKPKLTGHAIAVLYSSSLTSQTQQYL